jgi:hypothetical protein
MFDLPVEFVRKANTTPRCEGCIGLLAREAVPALPAYKAVLRVASADSTKAAKAPVVEIDLKALGLLDD